MREWLKIKSVQAVLVAVLFFIWGYNTYSIVEITDDKEKAKNPNKVNDIDIGELKIPETESFTYKVNFRDPFQPRLRKKKQRKPTVLRKQPIKKIRVPLLRLTGIVENMALIQNQKQELFFVSAGDTVDGARIRFVKKDSVGLTYKSKKFILKFNN